MARLTYSDDFQNRGMLNAKAFQQNNVEADLENSSPLSERTGAAPCGTNTVYIELILLSLRGKMWDSAGECGKRQIQISS
jgi:hypothetical protein